MGNACSSEMPDNKLDFEATMIDEKKKKESLVEYKNSRSTKITIKGQGSKREKD